MAKNRTKVLEMNRNQSRAQTVSHREIMGRILLQPWFLPKRIAFAIHGMVPPDFWNKMRYFFDDYGCMVCGKGGRYHSNGMCHRCHQNIYVKLKASLVRRLKVRRDNRLAERLFRQEKLAKRLLGKFARPRRSKSSRGRIGLPRQYNPVYEALCARYEKCPSPLTPRR
jgi:hypothetical protein